MSLIRTEVIISELGWLTLIALVGVFLLETVVDEILVLPVLGVVSFEIFEDGFVMNDAVHHIEGIGG